MLDNPHHRATSVILLQVEALRQVVVNVEFKSYTDKEVSREKKLDTEGITSLYVLNSPIQHDKQRIRVAAKLITFMQCLLIAYSFTTLIVASWLLLFICSK